VEPVNHEATSSKLKYGIEIIISEKKDETPKKSMFLYTETSEERVAWLAAIRSHANVHNIEDFYEIGKELGVGRFSSVRSAVSKVIISALRVPKHFRTILTHCNFRQLENNSRSKQLIRML